MNHTVKLQYKHDHIHTTKFPKELTVTKNVLLPKCPLYSSYSTPFADYTPLLTCEPPCVPWNWLPSTMLSRWTGWEMEKPANSCTLSLPRSPPPLCGVSPPSLREGSGWESEFLAWCSCMLEITSRHLVKSIWNICFKPVTRLWYFTITYIYTFEGTSHSSYTFTPAT